MPTTTSFNCACCGTSCGTNGRCFKQFILTYDCANDLRDSAWTGGAVQCLPENTDQSLMAQANESGSNSCYLTKWVPSGTACCSAPTNCNGVSFVTPALPSNAEAAACCCCQCNVDPNVGCDGLGCPTTFSVTLSGFGICDGTYTLKAVHTKAPGDPDVPTLHDCEWFLVNGDGSVTDDIGLSCNGIFDAEGNIQNGWLLDFAGTIPGVGSCDSAQWLAYACCPTHPCPGGTFVQVAGTAGKTAVLS